MPPPPHLRRAIEQQKAEEAARAAAASAGGSTPLAPRTSATTPLGTPRSAMAVDNSSGHLPSAPTSMHGTVADANANTVDLALGAEVAAAAAAARTPSLSQSGKTPNANPPGSRHQRSGSMATPAVSAVAAGITPLKMTYSMGGGLAGTDQQQHQ